MLASSLANFRQMHVRANVLRVTCSATMKDMLLPRGLVSCRVCLLHEHAGVSEDAHAHPENYFCIEGTSLRL